MSKGDERFVSKAGEMQVVSSAPLPKQTGYVSWEAARALVARRFASQLPPSQGTFMVAEYGDENEAWYHVIWGSREELNNADPGREILDPIVTLVSKLDGSIIQMPMIDALDILDQMTSIGMPPVRLR